MRFGLFECGVLPLDRLIRRSQRDDESYTPTQDQRLRRVYKYDEFEDMIPDGSDPSHTVRL